MLVLFLNVIREPPKWEAFSSDLDLLGEMLMKNVLLLHDPRIVFLFLNKRIVIWLITPTNDIIIIMDVQTEISNIPNPHLTILHKGLC